MKKQIESDAKRLAKEIKKSREWHHDIKYIDGKFVEEVVQEFQETKNEILIQKIIDNYAIFRKRWGGAFAMFLDNDIEDGEQMHDSIVWRSATKFNEDKARKKSGKGFNAYLVSALMNQMKNLYQAQRSHKNHPRAQCPICNELVYQIDHKHLRHTIDLARYRKMFPNYPLAAVDGMTICPITGISTERVTTEMMNRLSGRYTLEDFNKEFRIKPHGPYACPVTGTMIKELVPEYFEGLLSGYTEDDFIRDFEDWPGLLTCPFTGKKVVKITQEHLDEVLGQSGTEERYTDARFEKEYPNFTLEARQVNVVNPYTGRKVPEITPIMLAMAGTTVKEHLSKYATIILDKYYYDMVSCPFTGRRTRMIKKSDLEDLGRTIQDFYQVTCEYPLRKYQVRCAACGKWVDNIWDHLREVEHNYATSMTVNEFVQIYGQGSTRKTVSTNSYVESDAGDTVHIADLFTGSLPDMDVFEIEDSLLKVAEDDLDRKIARSIRTAHTFDDVMHIVGEIWDITLENPFTGGSDSQLHQAIQDQVQGVDYDLLVPPKKGEAALQIVVPGKGLIRRRLKRMMEASDIFTAENDT